MAFSNKALKLIVDFEGVNQPGKWPGGQSGITVGYGYDLGYVTVDQFESDWEGCFPDQQRDRLAQAVGKHGDPARTLAPSLADIRCTQPDSERVLLEHTIPSYTDKASRAFPGFERLPLDAQGALVSLVYNRGTSMVDKPGEDRRREMRAIRDLVPQLDLAGIAAQLRSMKRLWQGQGMDGLIRRREAEAALVESCVGQVSRGLRPARGVARAVGVSRGAPGKAPARKPAVKKAAAKKPAGKKPASAKPAAKKPVGRKATARPAARKPSSKAKATPGSRSATR